MSDDDVPALTPDVPALTPGAAAPVPGAHDGADAPRLLEVPDDEAGSFGPLEPATPVLTDRYGRLRLSFSRVDTYRNCPRRFRYTHVDRLPRKPSPHLSFGSSIHGALERFYDRKLPDRPSVDELLGFLYASWDPSGFAELPRSEQLEFYRHAQNVLRRFHGRLPDEHRLPAATEAWFEMPIGHEAVVVGSIDRVDVDDDGRFHLVDYKTNRRVGNRADVARSLQLALYAMACRHLYGALPETVALDFVVPGVVVRIHRDELELDAARQAVLDTAAAVRAEEFHPTPNRLCDWCDFKAVCPAWQGETDEVLGPAVLEAEAMRRRLRREVRELREREAGIARLAAELEEGGR